MRRLPARDCHTRAKTGNWANLGFEKELWQAADAMIAIERDNPSLKGVLPKDYAHPRLDKQRPGQLIDLVGNIGLGDKAGRRQDEPMQSEGRLWRAAISSEYIESPYPLQYYFELKEGPDSATLYPGLVEQLAGQPYFLARRG